MYGEDFHELTGNHNPACPLAGTTTLVESGTIESCNCPVCGAPLRKGDYRELIDVYKASDELRDVERELSSKEEELDEVRARLEDREQEIENMSSIISGLESERDDLRAEAEARER